MMTDRGVQIATFHSAALSLLETNGDTEETRIAIRSMLVDLATTPGIIPDMTLDRLHTAGSSATILHEGPDGIGALMLLRLPPAQATPVHNHNSWGISCVASGRNRYWRWERLDDGSDPGRGDLRLVEVLDQRPGDAILWGDPPQDWHAQQGLEGDAFEFVFFGRNPLLQPRAYYDPETHGITYAYASDRM
jgi:predicted metal-dependent enzyme (double-stranded beta helix superfamily)